MIKLDKRQYFFLVGKKLLEFVDIAGCRVNTLSIFKAGLDMDSRSINR